MINKFRFLVEVIPYYCRWTRFCVKASFIWGIRAETPAELREALAASPLRYEAKKFEDEQDRLKALWAGPARSPGGARRATKADASEEVFPE